MNTHEKLNYVEFPAYDLEKTKQFFNDTFGWKFEDFGKEYTAFKGEGLDGGFFQAKYASKTSNGSALLVFYSEDIKATQKKVELNGGTIVQELFSFPGGCRFHFCEPSGNEFAVWSDNISII